MPPSEGTYAVRAPRLYHYNRDSNTQVQEFVPNAVDLKNYALRHFASSDPARKPLCRELGSSLGAWLNRFHSWTMLPEQAGIQKTARSNSTMQGIKLLMNYPNLLSRADVFPSILDDARGVFAEVIEMATKELDRPDLHVIHGDFWTGKQVHPRSPQTHTHNANIRTASSSATCRWKRERRCPPSSATGRCVSSASGRSTWAR